MTMELLVGFFSASLFSLILTPLAIHLAVRLGALDYPGGRKVHSKPIPRLGGVAIFGSFFISLFVLLNLLPSAEPGWLIGREGIMFVASLTLVLALGIWDDLHSLKPSQKFLIQVFLATVAYLAGFEITLLTHPIESGSINLGFLSYPITVIWIVGVTNAVNLIDGLDGLASGVGTIAALTIFSISLLGNDFGSSIIAILLAGALIGFLPYNFNPARIFLGDSGSLFVGFTLALVSIQGGTRASTAFALIVPILALGFPIMDTLLAMVRRFLRSLLPETPRGSLGEKLRSMFTPDKGHIHHQLIAQGMSQRDAVFILYAISLVFGLSALGVTLVNNRFAALILIALGSVAVFGIRRLRYAEMGVLRSGLFLPLYEQPIFNREAFVFLLDFGFVLFSIGSSLALLSTSFAFDKQFIFAVSLISGPQLLVFWVTGLHRRTIAHFGIGDGISISKILFGAVASSAIVVFVASTFFNLSVTQSMGTVLLLDIYFLFTLVIGSRISFRVLKYMFQRGSFIGRKALIYGANATGMLVLQGFLDSPASKVSPVGFLDNDPKLEGKHLNGFRIYGSHWKIPFLVKRESVEEVIICADDLNPEVMNRLRRYSTEYRLKLTRPHILYEDVVHPQHDATVARDVSHVSSVAVPGPRLDRQ